MIPQHQHDCSACDYLGPIGSADVYICKGNTHDPTYILRYSSDGPDYMSHSDFQRKYELELRNRTVGGDDRYYARVTAIHLLATGITNLMKSTEEAVLIRKDLDAAINVLLTHPALTSKQATQLKAALENSPLRTAQEIGSVFKH